MKHPNEESSHKDPVCGMVVSRLAAVADAQYQRRTYYFCAHSCHDAFLADPQRYVRQHRQHGVRPKPSMS